MYAAECAFPIHSMLALHGVLLYTAPVTHVRTTTTATMSRIRTQRIRESGGMCAP